MKILSIASEMVPYIKTGGLADVAGALPAALAKLGVEMRVLVPAYRALRAGLSGEPLWSGAVLGAQAQVFAGAEGVLFLDAPAFFDRAGGIYNDERGTDHPDNALRFGALSLAGALIAQAGLADGWRPDLVHAHDWQGALAPVYLRHLGVACPSVLTVHNMAFQGISPRETLAALGLAEAFYADGTIEYWNQINVLKAGMLCADRVTTVSPSYAVELRRPEFGHGLDGVINALTEPVIGILNGIDAEVWSPEADGAITPYARDDLRGKAQNRAALLAEFGLKDTGGPLAIVVSRLTDQKGLDLLPDALPDFCARGGMMAILGTGFGWLEAALAQAAAQNPDQIGFFRGYDEGKSHRMFAGADAVLVPSRFEPCGLTQLYGLAYGAVPVVAATGGLRDSVIGVSPASLRAGVATGIVMAQTDGLSLHLALRQLTELYADAPLFAQIRQNGMAAGFGWAQSARDYADLYAKIVSQAAEKLSKPAQKPAQKPAAKPRKPKA